MDSRYAFAMAHVSGVLTIYGERGIITSARKETKKGNPQKDRTADLATRKSSLEPVGPLQILVTLPKPELGSRAQSM